MNDDGKKVENERKRTQKKTYVNKIDVVCYTATGSLVSISCNARQIFRVCVCVARYSFFLRFCFTVKSYHCSNRSTFPTIKWLFGDNKNSLGASKEMLAMHKNSHTYIYTICRRLIQYYIILSVSKTVNSLYTYHRTHSHTQQKSETNMVLRLADDSDYS